MTLRGTVPVKEALQIYKKAFNLDETSVPVLAGKIHCQIVEGQLGEAGLPEGGTKLHWQAGQPPLPHALLAHKKGQPHGDVMKALEEVVDVHFGTIKIEIFSCTSSNRTHQFIQRCLDRSPNSIPSLLMMAQINLHQGNPKLSMQSLEQALLSRHFEVQSFPLYHLVRARVVRAQENMTQAVASLKTATSFLTSSSKKQSPSLSIFSSSSSLLPPLTLGERLDVLTSASPRWDRRTWLTSSKNQSPSLHLLLLFLSPTSPNPWGEVLR
eukprot:Em0007g160a